MITKHPPRCSAFETVIVQDTSSAEVYIQIEVIYEHFAAVQQHKAEDVD